MNEEDAATWDALQTFSLGATVNGALTDIGGGSYTYANGDNDIGVAGDLEVLGTLHFATLASTNKTINVSNITAQVLNITEGGISNSAILSADIKDGEIDELDLDVSVNASLDLADTSAQVAGDTYTGALLLDDDASVQMDATADGMADDKYNGVTITGKNAGEAITQWDCVFLATDGKWDRADADASGEWPARGMACNATGDGTNLVVMVRGIVRNDGWAWLGSSIGKTLYLSDTTGGVTTNAPATSGDCVQVVGYVLSDDEISVNFSGHYLEVE